MKASEPYLVAVLVVDDSAVVRQRLCQLLKEEKRVHLVGAAGTAVDAVMLFEMHAPDAVLLDLHMPDFNGLEVLRWIKRSSHCCVVVVLTNSSLPEFREACQREGADYFFHKASEFEKAISVLGSLPPRNPQNRPTPAKASLPKTAPTKLNLL